MWTASAVIPVAKAVLLSSLCPCPATKPHATQKIHRLTVLLSILKKTEPVATDGRFEPLKTSAIFDSTAAHPEWLGYSPPARIHCMHVPTVTWPKSTLEGKFAA